VSTDREQLRRDAADAAWGLVGSVEWALDRGLLSGAPEHFVRAVADYLRRIDECWEALGVGPAGRASR
jgi:hypothetical protein